MNQQPTLDKRDLVFLKLWAASLLVLLGLTWKLWLPGFTEFPRVPLLGVQFAGLLTSLHWLATAALVGGLAGIIANPDRAQRWLGIAAVALPVLFVCNQHCLQPWAWQAFIIAALLFSLPVAESKKWIRWLLISIYVYSAAGKFDYQFVHSVGEQFVNTMLQMLGLGSTFDGRTVSSLVMLLPAGEAVIAIGLIFRETRRAAAWLAILLHTVLFALLSPWGMGHQPPVLIWNGVSILLLVWFFLSDSNSKDQTRVVRSKGLLSRLAMFFALLVLLGPLLRPVGLWDHWLAWGLYSPSNSRVEAHVSETVIQRVAPSLQPYFWEEEQYGVRRFAMEHWSLEELGVPIYPQARFQRAVAAEVLRQQDLTSFAEVIEYGQAHPLTGVRSKSTIELTE